MTESDPTSDFAGYYFSNSADALTATVNVPGVSCPATGSQLTFVWAFLQGAGGYVEDDLEFSCTNGVLSYSGFADTSPTTGTGSYQSWTFTPSVGDQIEFGDDGPFRRRRHCGDRGRDKRWFQQPQRALFRL